MLRRISKVIPENNKIERIWILAKTDFIQRYYGTVLGLLWAFINPMIRISVYYFAFTLIFKNRIPNYALYLFSGLIFWFLFQEATKKGITLLKTKRYLIENIHINKLDIFIASLLSVMFAFFFNFTVYLFVSFFFSIDYSWNILFFPLLLANVCILILGINLILSTLYIYIRDITHAWDMFLFVSFWVNPILFRGDVIYQQFPILIYLSPLAGIIINVRNVLMYGSSPDMFFFVYDYVFAIIFFAIGIRVFNKYSYKAAESV